MLFIVVLGILLASYVASGWTGICLALLALGFIWWIASYNTKRISARNAVYSALTFRQLSQAQKTSIDAQVKKILARGKLDVDVLGAPYTNDGASSPSSLSTPAVVFAFRSLAMHELKIPPIGTKVAKWYVLRNPFNTKFAGRHIKKYRQKVLRETGINLTELD